MMHGVRGDRCSNCWLQYARFDHQKFVQNTANAPPLQEATLVLDLNAASRAKKSLERILAKALCKAPTQRDGAQRNLVLNRSRLPRAASLGRIGTACAGSSSDGSLRGGSYDEALSEVFVDDRALADSDDHRCVSASSGC
jgi:hypothetical protein